MFIHQAELLKSVFSNWSNLDQVVEGGKETVTSRLKESETQILVHKCLYLCIAYKGGNLAWDGQR